MADETKKTRGTSKKQNEERRKIRDRKRKPGRPPVKKIVTQYVGARIRQRREELNLDPETLFERLFPRAASPTKSSARNVILSFERGDKDLEIHMLLCFAEVLETTPFYFYQGLSVEPAEPTKPDPDNETGPLKKERCPFCKLPVEELLPCRLEEIPPLVQNYNRIQDERIRREIRQLCEVLRT